MGAREVRIDAHTKYYTLATVLEATVKQFPERPFLGHRGIKQYEWTTYKEFHSLVGHMRAALAQKGIKRGDRVGIISKNSLEWAVCAYASYGLGAAFVAMYEKQDIAECKYIVEDSELKILFVETQVTFEAAKHWVSEFPQLEHVIFIGGQEDTQDSYKGMLKGVEGKVKAIDKNVLPSDLANIIYTSGTTGYPKGVMLSHENQLTSCGAVEINFPLNHEDRMFSMLPWAHVLGLNGDLNAVILLGASVGLLESKERLVENFSEVKPTFVITVPALLNKILATIDKRIQKLPKPFVFLFRKGIRAGERKYHKRSMRPTDLVYYPLCRLLFLNGIKKRLGGNLKNLFVGGSAMDKKVMNFYYSVGLPVYQGYGLSETAAMICATCPKHNKIGSVGKVLLDNVSIKLDTSLGSDEPGAGEILFRGKNVMQGYLKQPEENQKAFTEDGWLRTGDVGEFDSDGYLHIIGRVKEQYKLSNGKYIVPSLIEEKFKLSPFIDNVSVIGENMPHNVAIISLNKQEVLEALKKNTSASNDNIENKDLLNSQELVSLINKELTDHQVGLKAYEKIKNFHLTFDEWTPDNNLLTQTLKIKRREVQKRYAQVIKGLY